MTDSLHIRWFEPGDYHPSLCRHSWDHGVVAELAQFHSPNEATNDHLGICCNCLPGHGLSSSENCQPTLEGIADVISLSLNEKG